MPTQGGVGQNFCFDFFRGSMDGQHSRMDRASFELAYRKLTAARAQLTANVGSVACERCVSASLCMFCVDCKQIERCQYCTRCNDCVDCAHCEASRELRSCQHCAHCERCTGSAYLVRCDRCDGCSYCFGCVGLTGKDFHILNEPYDRQTYFAMVAQLSRELGLR
jgi:hypothetical protein